MEFTFRCNSLKCRQELTEDAVVTTCSHIFCLPCANSINLPNTQLAHRVCPACKARLSNRDDCAMTTLSPSEDYKTSVLSGFGPSVIMECAARALAFYSYQATQEITYQTFLNSSLSGKYNQKSSQMEAYAMQATSEIQRLQELLEEKQNAITSLENKHHELADAFREKGKALQETQSKYQAIKSRLMTAEQQYAASDEAEQALQGGSTMNIPNQFYGATPSRVSTAMPYGTPSFPTRIPRATGTTPRPPRSRLSTSQGFNPNHGPTPTTQRTRFPMPNPLHIVNEERHGPSENSQGPSRSSFSRPETSYMGQRSGRRKQSLVPPATANHTHVTSNTASQFHF